VSGKTSESAEQTEKVTEKLRLWQLIVGGIVGFAMAFLPMAVAYIDKTYVNPPKLIINCEGKISITYPKNKTVVYGDRIDVAGTVEPKEGCKNVFLIVGTLDGHNYFTTDSVTINPDGTWDATAKLHFVPQGTRARIQARLCGESNAYPPEGCLPEVPNRGIASNSVVISREAGVPIAPPKTSDSVDAHVKTKKRAKAVGLGVIEFSNIFAAGYVTGIGKAYNDYKVVIYYKDSKYGWVKQPHPGDQPGVGWAIILPNGEWSIALKERPSDKMNLITKKTIMLMKRSQFSPDRVAHLRELKAVVKEIR